MKILYYDCFAGISGDMNLGALVDVGVDFDRLVESLKKLDLYGYELRRSCRAMRGVTGTKIDVIHNDEPDRRKGAYQHKGDFHGRSFTDIKALIQGSRLSDGVKKTSIDIFSRIARAEGKIHGADVEEVHFHEVGAVDSIIDIVGAAVCLEILEVDRVMSSPVELGGGFVTCAHGTLPVPAPATLEILRGIPVTKGGAPFELTTPTGAAVLASTVDCFTSEAAFRPLKIGYGVGTRDIEIPNVLRVILGEAEPGRLTDGDNDICLVECNIDDMSPEMLEHVMDRLFDAGAIDVYLTPVIMKKSRPAVVLSAVCEPSRQAEAEEIILQETTTLGVRKQRLGRTTLDRDLVTVQTDLGEVRVKRALRGPGRITWKPEYEDCRRIALERGVPLKEVYDAVERTRVASKEEAHEG